MSEFPAAYIRAIFECDESTGGLVWKRRDRADFATQRAATIWNVRFAGKEAGFVHSDGYHRVKVCGKSILTHRLVWCWVTGAWPLEQIDHIDANRQNNAFSNLREATQSQNCANKPKSRVNTTGFKGVSRSGRKFIAYIKKDQKRVHLGSFTTAEEASAAYRRAASDLFGNYARTL